MAIKKQYAVSQVCEITLDRAEIERMLVENLSERGTPGYDFEQHKPFIVWNQNNSATIRYFQAAAFAPEEAKFMTLKPYPTKEEAQLDIQARADKVVK